MEVLQQFFTGLMNADGNLLLLIQEHVRNPWLTQVMKTITTLGNHGLIWIVIGVILLFPKKTRRAGILSLLALLSAHLLCNYFLKDYVARVRPFDVIPGLVCLIERPTDWSFPSGHTMTAFASAIVILRSCKKPIGVPVMILACLMAFSRLYVGVHYPTDVFFGAVLGILIGLIFFWIFGEKKYKRKARRKRAQRRRS